VYAAGLGRLMIAPRRKLQLHRWVSAGLLAAVAGHVAAVVLTHFRGWGLMQALTLGRGPLARNCGAAAVWLLLLIVLTRWLPLMRAIGPRVTRFLHRLSYLVLVFGTAHAVLAGPHADSLAIAGPGIACLTALAAALVSRHHQNLARRRPPPRSARPVPPLRSAAQHRA
jgi:DMSO/TMAO reductase YedYZ heme-binding membrane subunit